MEQKKYTFDDLLGIMKKLRAPDGCPWDAVQTHESIKKHVVEEAYELVEAIDGGDPKKMADESGDLLLQAVFHAAIAEDAGEYTIDDVTDAICRKMIHRHPHLFEGGSIIDWDEIKRRDREQKTVTQELLGISAYLPALMRAEKISKKTEKQGFIPDTVSHLENEEFRLGAQLFSLVTQCRENAIDPELALNRYLRHYIDAFQKFEETKENKNET
ncbi:MAG: MazG family protein [Clostridia bacterium]|nr:MazG family protein [Clostridia bacterium]